MARLGLLLLCMCCMGIAMGVVDAFLPTPCLSPSRTHARSLLCTPARPVPALPRRQAAATLAMQTKEFTEAQMDFQWNTMKKNFDATWKGRSEWYRKGDAPVLDLETPSHVRADTQYDISFDSDITGTWAGTGLGLTDQKVVLPLARTGFNQADAIHSWIFPGAGGQGSAELTFQKFLAWLSRPTSSRTGAGRCW